tara:strand:- start:885 stop:1400 length:516 start_codon:yes stop_codon:yes gene_type:complete
MDTVKFSLSQGMISSQGEVQERVFEKVQGKRYTWYVAMQEDRADNVYVSTENKQGMGGAVLPFKLQDGSIDQVQAPWHSSSCSLLEDTGLDVTNTSRLSYIISEVRESPTEHYGAYTCKGVLEHVEEELMTFNTPEERGQYFANKLGKMVYVTSRSSGGGCAGWSKPEEEK